MSRLLIVAAAVLSLAGCGDTGAGTAAPTGQARTLGKPDAPVKVVDYASMSCGHCMDFNNKEFPAFKAQYIDTGKVLYELREMLTDPSQLSAAGFLLAACTGQDRYFDTVDKIFKNLPAIYQDQRGGLLAVAREQGLSEAAFDKCMADEEALKALGARVEENAAKATGTPTFYINDRRFEGPNTAADLGRAVDAVLAAK